MVYKLLFTKSAERNLEKLDPQITKKILGKLKEYLGLKNPLEKAKKLKNFNLDTFRFRIGNYRVIFRKDQKTGELVILVILKIAHRKEVYKER